MQEAITALEDEEKRYSYDIYRLKSNYRDDLEKNLNDNENSGLFFSKIRIIRSGKNEK